jgi:hypothetical protein
MTVWFMQQDFYQQFKMKKLILTLCFTIVAMVSYAQEGQNTYTADTLTNSQTKYFTYPRTITQGFSYAHGITATELSGSPTLIVALQELVEASTWVEVARDTLILSGTPNAASTIISGPIAFGLNQRLALINSGTGVTRVTGKSIYKKNP